MVGLLAANAKHRNDIVRVPTHRRKTTVCGDENVVGRQSSDSDQLAHREAGFQQEIEAGRHHRAFSLHVFPDSASEQTIKSASSFGFSCASQRRFTSRKLPSPIPPQSSSFLAAATQRGTSTETMLSSTASLTAAACVESGGLGNLVSTVWPQASATARTKMNVGCNSFFAIMDDTRRTQLAFWEIGQVSRPVQRRFLNGGHCGYFPLA
jgi:hypothetical protein